VGLLKVISNSRSFYSAKLTKALARMIDALNELDVLGSLLTSSAMAWIASFAARGAYFFGQATMELLMRFTLILMQMGSEYVMIRVHCEET